MSRVEAVNVCFKQGHLIQSLIKSRVVDPVTKAAVETYDLRCIQCGMGPRWIENSYKNYNQGKKRGKDGKFSGHAPSTTDSDFSSSET